MRELVNRLNELKKSEIQKVIQRRMAEFKGVGERGDDRWFSELSFCVLTANSSAKLGIEIQDSLGIQGFIELPLSRLQRRLKELGHRFYRTRAEYIVENRGYSDRIKGIIKDFSCPEEARKWLAENVKGIGYKEGSHFLRNVGYEDLMILDRHILRIVDRFRVIDHIPKTLTRKRYL